MVIARDRRSGVSGGIRRCFYPTPAPPPKPLPPSTEYEKSPPGTEATDLGTPNGPPSVSAESRCPEQERRGRVEGLSEEEALHSGSAPVANLHQLKCDLAVLMRILAAD
jgi:hypothetical protein